MELKHVIPNMEKTFGTLEFAGENKVEQRRINGRMTVVSRSFNLYSDVQRADDIICESSCTDFITLCSDFGIDKFYLFL